MCTRQHRRSAAILIVLALLLAGCATGEAEPAAGKFLVQHAAAIELAAGATRRAEAELAGVSMTPTGAQLEALQTVAIRGRREVAPASEWGATEDGEEENTGEAETEVSEGASRILGAMAALRAYASHGRPSSRALYSTQLARAREQWNSGVSELWHLGKRGDPPTI